MSGHGLAAGTITTPHMKHRSSHQLVWAWLSTRRRKQLILLAGCSVLGALAELATIAAVVPFLSLLTKAADGTVTGRTATVLAWLGWTPGNSPVWYASLLFAVVAVIASGLLLTVTWANIRYTQALGHDLGCRIYHRVLHQSYWYHVSHNTSEILAGIDKVTTVVVGVLRPALDGASAAILAMFILVGLIAIDPVASGVAILALGSVYWSVSRVSRARVVRNSRTASRGQTERLQALQEGLGGIRDILLDRSQAFHEERFARIDNAFRRALVENALWGHAPRYVVEALGVGIIAGLAVWITERTGGIGAALPILGALALGAQRLLPQVQRIYIGWNQVMGHRGALEDLSALLDAPINEHATRRGDPARLPFTREVRLASVGFRYGDEGPWVLRDFDLVIRRGARLGIVGETGGGKSTFLDVLMGLLAPVEGQILVDDMPVTASHVADWQARIAHVPQAIYLADCSIAENIAFGLRPEQIDLPRVEEAARRAHIHEFVETLPEGYRTFVGERGVRLSGGQRQRIGVARALYRDADVLILDEATSALDSETEATVMEGIEAVGDDVTLIIVAHRLSTLDRCDTIIRLQPPAHRDPPLLEAMPA